MEKYKNKRKNKIIILGVLYMKLRYVVGLGLLRCPRLGPLKVVHIDPGGWIKFLQGE